MKYIVFCVNYNSYKETEEYLYSLQNAISKRMVNNDELEVVIADNSFPTQELNCEVDYEYTVLETGKNLGYFGGIQAAIQLKEERLSDYDYFIVSNVDLRVDEDFFINLNSVDAAKDVGCIAPSIFSLAEKKDRNPKINKRPTSKKLKLLKFMYDFPPLYYFYSKFVYTQKQKRVNDICDSTIYAPHGSFIIFSKQAIELLRNMAYPIFLFGEEIYVAELLRGMNLKVKYCPQIVVFDKDHVSTGKLKSKAFFNYNRMALDYLLREFFDE